MEQPMLAAAAVEQLVGQVHLGLVAQAVVEMVD
jgi:hypothetical protein